MDAFVDVIDIGLAYSEKAYFAKLHHPQDHPHTSLCETALAGLPHFRQSRCETRLGLRPRLSEDVMADASSG